jgi:hypothetical protein
MIAYVLNKQIDGEKILKDIQQLVNSYNKNYPNQTPVLTISIRTISHDDTSLIPKLEFKPCST